MDRSTLNALFDLTGRTAIVTGGTRGIGLSVAHGLAAAGANVAVASRKSDACARAAEQLRQAGAEAIGVPTHLGDIDAIQHLVDATVERFCGVDIVINNAANALAMPLGEITSEGLSKSFAVNLQGPVFLVQAALQHLRKSEHAAIVNVVSAGAFVYSPATSMYSAAKAALVSFTRSMAAELASSRIRVNAIAPGPVDTDMVRNNPPEFIAALRASTLQQRIAEPDEMVGPVLLLVSDAGSYITGQTIHADGGMVAR